LLETGLSQAQWENYHTEMLDFRNKFVLHVDLSKPFKGSVPHFDRTLQVVYVYQEWVREVIKPIAMGQPTLRWEYELLKAHTFSVLSQQAHP
jgi:hypothetical protein